MADHSFLKGVTYAGVVITVVVVVLGAYTRLVDAGLGCPDWPACYGFLSVPESAQELRLAEARFPQAPVDVDKAWAEMVHRYFASALGLLSLVILGVAYRQRVSLTLPLALLILVIVQGAFGAWTVTLKLWPQVVTAHLLGGFATLGLLWLYALKLGFSGRIVVAAGLRTHAAWALAFVVLQIALGGWVSSNYAALACPDFPACHGRLMPDMDFGSAFNLAQDVGPNYLGGQLSSDARVAIQMTHRLGAFVVLLMVGALALRMLGDAASLGWTLLGILFVQFGLGVANVLGELPLIVATLHNAGGAGLLIALITINWAARGRHRAPV
ncbi:MAG: COX15/CtaA family protein [Gammaproteobacteria bacterium]|nr:COX15/CtaA family protein [Gammaproteobacteria bacterium]